MLRRWQAQRSSVWDVIERIERLRAQHVFPMSLLRLEEHEWKHMLSDASASPDQPPAFVSSESDGGE